ncbi:hypothetical protein TYRP_009953 [Tyrophagus putrescentiae]|nr:hypothetical protein TYRP_009953 [Tyrophagus putrescentiae]
MFCILTSVSTSLPYRTEKAKQGNLSISSSPIVCLSFIFISFFLSLYAPLGAPSRVYPFWWW